MHSNRYTVLYAVSVTVTVAVILAMAATGLSSFQEENIARARRTAILETVIEVDDATLEQDYAAFITEQVFDREGNAIDDVAAFDLDIAREARKQPEDRRYPVYVFERQGETHFIVPLYGAGLWGPISAYLALDSDLSTIYGVRFDHEKETPGLGAEIATPGFEDRFRDKRLVGDAGEFESVRVVRGAGAGDDPHAVDGLTGATMTMNGVTRMFEEELMLYEQIFEELGS